MDVVHAIAWGCVGGVLPDVVRIIKGRFGDIPGYLKSPMFWVGLVLLVELGGFVSWLGTAREVKDNAPRFRGEKENSSLELAG